MTAYFLSFVFIASNGFADVQPGPVRDWLIMLACFLGLILLGVTLFDKLKAKKPQEIGPNPFPISILDEMPTRREFTDLKNQVQRMDQDNSEMERRILAAIKESGRETRAEIKMVGTTAYEGRKKLHEKVARNGERIAAIEAQRG